MQQKKSARLPSINLVPKDPFYETFVGKAMTWALHVGRYLIIFTEIIVIISFASRFKLDRDLSDINSLIVQKTAVVKSYASVEKQMRLIQKKSQIINQLLQENTSLSEFDTLISQIPSDVKVARLKYDPQEMLITGTAQSATSFSLFLQALQKVPAFHTLTIDQIATGDQKDPGVAFSIRIGVTASQPNTGTIGTTQAGGTSP